MDIESRRFKRISAVIMLSALILIVLSAFLFPDEPVYVSGGNAFVYENDALIRSNGKDYHCEMTEDGGGSFSVGSGNELTLSLIIPSFDDIKYPAMLMKTRHCCLDILLDGELLFSQKSGYATFQRLYPIVINIPKYSSGSELSIVYRNTSPYDMTVLVSPVIFGDRQVIEKEYLSEDSILHFLAAAVNIFSLILICFSLFFRKNEGRELLMSIGLFSFTASHWLMFRTQAIFTIVDSPFIVRETCMLLFTFIPQAMTVYIRENIISRDGRRHLKVAEIFSCLFLVSYIALTILMIWTSSYSICLFRLFWITYSVLVYMFLLVIFSFREGDREIKYRYGSLAAILLFTLSAIGIIVSGRLELKTYSFFIITTLASLALLIQQSVMICIRSITRKEKREEMMKRVYTDPLTGMLNRRAYEDRADTFDPGTGGMLVITADIDMMKQFNDSLGHSAGDELLTAFSKSVSSVLSRHDGACYRMGGDEFLILIRNGRSLDADEIMREVAVEFTSSVSSGNASFSYGATLWETGSAADLLEAVRRSDDALLIAKADNQRRLRQSVGASSTLPNTSF